MAIQGRTLRGDTGRQRTDVTAGLSRLYDAGFHGSGGGRRSRGYHNRGRRPWIAVAGAAVVLALGGAVLATRVNWTTLDVNGIAEGQELGRKDLAELSVRVEASGPAAGEVRVEVNGTEIPVVEARNGEALVTRRKPLVGALKTGNNTLKVTLDGKSILGGEQVERTFSYNPAGPRLMVPAEVLDPADGQPVTVRGLVDNAAAVTANGQPVTLDPGGAFTLEIPAGLAEFSVDAIDGDGNEERKIISVTPEPAAAKYPETAAVHVAAGDWANPAIRQQILDLAESGRINAVQLDIKDEGGEVGYRSNVALANKIGADKDYYDPEEAVAELHALDVRVIGRVVCFLDPALASWAAENERPDLIVLDGSGSGPLANNYGTAAFTNLASAEVRDYQMDLATEAVSFGFDEILYDYVRRPEGDPSSMRFDGLKTAADVAVARFVAESNERLEGTGALLGVSVFGIASTRPEQIAQDIQLMAPHVDYVSPMVYPSHWGPGEFGVADPVRQPGAIVRASVDDFHRVVAGSGAAVVAWLQDFDSGDVLYDTEKVSAQIDATLATGSPGFLLWNPVSEYTIDALSPLAD
ncbi:MAG: putative glycoside hydrolase [Actinomycetota bacterium]|nr:putative glycoside hydrolase [Actinomycetota bacterium]